MTADPPDPRSAVGAWVRHQVATGVLARFAESMAEARVPWLPVKGIVSAYTLYDDPAQRQMVDIDVRVRQHDFGRVVRIARARGWAVQRDTPRLWEVEITLDGWIVDVAGTVGPPGLCALPVSSLIGRATNADEPFGFTHLRPEVHDHALVLCLNAFKDRLAPSPWAREDLLRVARRPDFRAQALVERAREGRVTMAVGLVAHWLADGADEWARIESTLGAAPPRALWARVYRGGLGRPPSRADLWVVGAASDDRALAARGAVLTTLGWLRGGVMRRLRS